MKGKNKNNVMTSPEKSAARIRQLRQENNMTQIDLARKLMVSRSCVGNWETATRSPEWANICEMARIFKVPIDYILGISEYKYKIFVPEYIELDLNKLNNAGLKAICDYYDLLVNNDKYRKKVMTTEKMCKKA